MRKQRIIVVLAASTLAVIGGASVATALIPTGGAQSVLSQIAASDVQQIRHRHWPHRHHRGWGHHHHRRWWKHRHRRHGFYGFVPRIYIWGGHYHH